MSFCSIFTSFLFFKFLKSTQASFFKIIFNKPKHPFWEFPARKLSFWAYADASWTYICEWVDPESVCVFEHVWKENNGVLEEKKSLKLKFTLPVCVFTFPSWRSLEGCRYSCKWNACRQGSCASLIKNVHMIWCMQARVIWENMGNLNQKNLDLSECVSFVAQHRQRGH